MTGRTQDPQVSLRIITHLYEMMSNTRTGTFGPSTHLIVSPSLAGGAMLRIVGELGDQVSQKLLTELGIEDIEELILALMWVTGSTRDQIVSGMSFAASFVMNPDKWPPLPK